MYEAPTPDEREAAARSTALAQGWIDNAEGVTLENHDECSYEAGAVTFLMLTDEEADNRTKESIRESAWAFNASFLVDYVPSGLTEAHIDAMRGDSCESFNEPVLALIEAGKGFEDFWSDAMDADGRGHFLAGYDSEEIEVGDIDGHDWYAYRTN